MAKNETGVMARLRPETHARLRRACQRLGLLAADGLISQWWADEEPTSNELIDRLLARHEAHAHRAKKQRKARAAKKRAEAMEDICLPTSGYYVNPDGIMVPHPFAGAKESSDGQE